ncbi:MAG: efflux RND transporter permease subunit [Verrucomicrobiota bacterium]|jgi:multidrug efflux pump subunit AcrB|nr:efflux RND transporter permease subunit [Verrucomicrobiota bacterium]
MSIAQFSIDKKVITYAFTAAILLGGMLAYTKIGRLEDPEFTIKAAQIITMYPGTTAQEVLEEITDPIEIAVQKMGQLKRVTSTSYPGRSIIMVEMEDKYGKKDLPQIWDELRHKVADMQDSLPTGASVPLVADDFGDVYGVFYAIYGDGYSFADLKAYAKLLRRELLQCEDVAKIDMIGDQQEVVYLEISRARMAGLGITPQQIQSVISGQNTAADAGSIEIGDKYIRISPTGKLQSVEELGELLLVQGSAAGQQRVRLKDLATIRRAYQEPADALLRYNGHPCIGLGISTAKGGNVMVMGASIDKRMLELQSETPVGIEVGIISHQADSVDVAIRGFIVSLVEAVLIVVAVLLFSMGLQSGILIGAIVIVTVMSTLMVMQSMGILLERISLGAFIIALGMLVDNAIVITEAVLIAAQKGLNKVKAAVEIVEQTKWPLLGATGVAILSFAPIGASQDSTGEFCRSLFLVLLISLFMSWVLAITLTPLLASSFLKVKKQPENAKPVDPYDTHFFRAYRGLLIRCIRHRWLFMLVMVVLLLLAGYGFRFVKQNFFPDSTRPQMMVHLWMPEGSSIYSTAERIQQLGDHVKTLDGVTGITDMVGTGGLRFLLTYTPEDPDPAYGILFVDIEDSTLVPHLSKTIDEFARENIPDALVYSQRFVLGPGDPQKIQMRIIGTDAALLRQVADKALDVMRADPKLVEIQSDWRNRVDLIRPVISTNHARNLGITRTEIAAAFKEATTGIPIGAYKEGDESLPILLRAPEHELEDPDSLFSAWFWAARLGRSIPLSQLVDRFENTSEEALLQRRNRSLCITVKCNTSGEETAATAFKRLAPKLLAATADMPEGYFTEWGGEHESSTNANSGLAGKIPPIVAIMILIVIALFNSIRQPVVIFMTVPLTLIGVTVGLLVFGQPFGFMALLGFLSLGGMQLRNAIVLIDEINAQKAHGENDFNAIVNAGVIRLRPVVMAATTTVLGMLPLVVDAFYASMAVTIMCGLTFATILTMVVIPVNYAIVFRVPNPH